MATSDEHHPARPGVRRRPRTTVEVLSPRNEWVTVGHLVDLSTTGFKVEVTGALVLPDLDHHRARIGRRIELAFCREVGREVLDDGVRLLRFATDITAQAIELLASQTERRFPALVNTSDGGA